MANILLIVICLIIGGLLQKVQNFPDNAAKSLNAFLIYVVLPAVSLLYIPKINLSFALLLPILVSWIIFTVSWLLFGTLGRRFAWKRTTIGCLIICGGLPNTGYVGYPIIEAIYGAAGLKIAILTDQPGSFIVVSSVAIIVASLYGKEKMRKRDITKRMLFFPPFGFFIIALILNVTNFPVPSLAEEILQSFAYTLTPLALVAVGLQLRIKLKDVKDSYLWYGLGFKLLLAPFVIYVLYSFLLDDNPEENLIFQVSVMEAAMAPMVTSAIIATNYDLNPKLASLMVGIGIPLSFITLIGWYFLVN